ncbi:MAG TPA: hypothetical protein VL996_03885, partial [Methylocella sp.]|nr:hypothetical protein [Methylocella sp.]
LWKLKRLEASRSAGQGGKTAKLLECMDLSELIDAAEREGVISAKTAKQGHLARDARNLIHPGKVARSGSSCSKSTALTAFAAVYQVAEELTRVASAAGSP